MGYRFDETKGCGVDCEMSQDQDPEEDISISI
jgi:hypothetical protein